MSKPRYRIYYVRKEVYAYNFAQAERKSFQFLKEIEQNLNLDYEFARLFSIDLPFVEKDQWRQKFVIRFKIFKPYLVDLTDLQKNHYLLSLKQKKQKLYYYED